MSARGSTELTWKRLCFAGNGSCQIGIVEATNRQEAANIQEEIDRMTTPQFRAPEQCSVSSGTVIGTKVCWGEG